MAPYLENWSQMKNYLSAGLRLQLFFLSSVSTRRPGFVERIGYKSTLSSESIFHDLGEQVGFCFVCLFVWWGGGWRRTGGGGEPNPEKNNDILAMFCPHGRHETAKLAGNRSNKRVNNRR